ncbi:MAG: TorF family putative porin [Syntrophotaleaceae bacterium]
MKKAGLALVAALILGCTLAAPTQAAIEVEGDVYVGLWDKYLWRGFDLSDGRPTIQGGIDLSMGNWTLSTWHNWQLSSGPTKSSGELNETDIILTYGFDVGEMVSMSIGNIWYSLDNEEFGVSEDTNELFVTATLNTMLSPNLKISWDWDAAEEDGLFYSLDISHSFDLGQWLEKTTLNLGALVSYNQHADGTVADYAGWHNYELSTSVDYALTDQLTLSGIGIFSSGISSAAKEIIDTETAFALNLTFTF